MDSEKLIETIPYGVYIKNKQMQYTTFNNQFLQHLKINNPTFLQNKSDYDLPWCCYAESYQSDDQYVIEQKKHLTIINPARINKIQTLLLINKRSPILNNQGHVEGIFSMASPLSDHQFYSAMFLLYERDDYYVGNDYKQIGYIISDSTASESLTQKEFECLFFILRGKSARCRRLSKPA